MLLKPIDMLALVIEFSPFDMSGDARTGDSVQGSRLQLTAELAGQMFPDDVRKTTKLLVKDDKYTVTLGAAVDQGTVKLNPAARPKEMDITGTDGPDKSRTIRAVYEQDGGALRIRYDLGGMSRLTEFKTREGTQLYLVTYERAKP